ncbi:hypothetical protein [Escherichia coli]|uniref:hypothetical protein n=1 Tax=Escherichia coli TaxID=562 RepID=UPI00066CEC76|nr:hypothetical protein [Escherichia coli]KMV61270.1 hypothetical protein ACM21_00860 [Escherichia coli]
MKIDNIQLHSFLRSQDITYFHHANTVATAISFIRNGGLVSRSDIERLGAFQTKQESDPEDKQYDVWGDVFLDTVDLHGFFPRQNLYGPVLFKFNIDFLLHENLDIWITKTNPMFWIPNMSSNERYFQGMSDILLNWNDFDRQRKMITIRKPYHPVLFKYLEEIVLDDPGVQIYDETILYDVAHASLSIELNNVQLPLTLLTKRHCSGCFCQDNYLRQLTVEKLISLFLAPQHKHWRN